MAFHNKDNEDGHEYKEPDDVSEMMKSYVTAVKQKVQHLETVVNDHSYSKPTSATDHGARIPVSEKTHSLEKPVSRNDCALGKSVSVVTLGAKDGNTEAVSVCVDLRDASSSSISSTSSSMPLSSVTASSKQSAAGNLTSNPLSSTPFADVVGGIIDKMRPILPLVSPRQSAVCNEKRKSLDHQQNSGKSSSLSTNSATSKKTKTERVAALLDIIYGRARKRAQNSNSPVNSAKTTTTVLPSLTRPRAGLSEIAGNNNDSLPVPMEPQPAIQSLTPTPQNAGEPENKNEPPESRFTTSDSHDIMQLYEMSWEPNSWESCRRPFLDALLSYLEEKGTPLSVMPFFMGQPLDLFCLYMKVKKKGGMVEVTKAQWNSICKAFCGSSSKKAVTLLRESYIKYLFAFECQHDRGGMDPAQILEDDEYRKLNIMPPQGSQESRNRMPSDPKMVNINGPHGAPVIGSGNMVGPYDMGPCMQGLGHMMGSMGYQNYPNFAYIMQDGPNSVMDSNMGPQIGQNPFTEELYPGQSTGPQVLPYSSAEENVSSSPSNSTMSVNSGSMTLQNSNHPRNGSTAYVNQTGKWQTPLHADIHMENQYMHMYKCKKCGKHFQALNAFLIHVNRGICITEKKQPKYKCRKCGKLFKTLMRFSNHQNNTSCRTEEQKSQNTCKKCGKCFQSFKDFVLHVNGGSCRIGIEKSMFDSNLEGQKPDGIARESNPQCEQHTASINDVSENSGMGKVQSTVKQSSQSLINQKVLIKKGNAFYSGIIRICNRKGTVGVLFDGDEEITYLVNSDSRYIISNSIPSSDELAVGCMVCVRLNSARDKFYEGEILEIKVGQLVWYRVCLVLDKHKKTFGEDVWVTKTEVRLLQQCCFTTGSGKLHVLAKLQNQVSEESDDSCNKFNDNHNVHNHSERYLEHDNEHGSDQETMNYASDAEQRIEEIEQYVKSESNVDNQDTCSDQGNYKTIKVEIISESSDDGKDENKNGHKHMETLLKKKKLKKKNDRAKKLQAGLPVDKSADKNSENEIEHKCDYCDDIFEDAVKLRQHRNIHIQKRPFFCEFCEKSFLGKVQLSQHLLICWSKDLGKNKIGKKTNCTKSPKMTHTSKLTREGASIPLKEFQCPTCKRMFSHYNSLQRHNKNLHGNKTVLGNSERKKYYCSFCTASFFSYQGLYLHKKKLHKNGKMTSLTSITKKYECTLCQTYFSSHQSLLRHSMTIHKSDEKQVLHDRKMFDSDSLKKKLNITKEIKSHTGQKWGASFLCGICNKQFSRTSYYLHKFVHLKKKPFSCSRCKRQFSQRINFNTHKCVTGTCNFKCEYCNALFSSEQALKIHRSYHTEENVKKKYCCKYCEKKYNSKFRLQSHMQVCKTVHCSSQILQDKEKNSDRNKEIKGHLLPREIDQSHQSQDGKACLICSRQFSTKSGLQMHNYHAHRGSKSEKKSTEAVSHQNQDGKTCFICSRQFSTKFGLKMHNYHAHRGSKSEKNSTEAVSHQNQDGKACLICCRQFSTKFGLKMHNYHAHRGSKSEKKSTETVKSPKETEDDNLRLSTKCEVCSKIFSSVFALKKHSYIHLDVKPFKCIKCEKTFAQKVQLKLHKCKASPKCEVSSKIFSSFSDLKKHSFIHLDVKPFKCIKCEKTFAQKVQLRLHRCKAGPVKGVRCNICSETFSSALALKRHKCIKVGSKTFKCLKCRKTFENKWQIHLHRRAEECEASRLKCEICAGTYSSLNALKKHRNIHLEIKPFKCKKCEKTFAQNCQLKRHNKNPCGSTTIKRNCDVSTFDADLQHQEKNRNSPDNPEVSSHTCAICSSTFRSGEELHRHFKLSRCALGSFSKLSHIGEPTMQQDFTPEQMGTKMVKYECGTCNKAFSDCSFLELHISSGCPGKLVKSECCSEGVETDVVFGLFECGLCLLNFSSDLDMISHFKLEHGEFQDEAQDAVSYACGKCNSEFDSSKNLDDHMQHCFQENLSSVFTCGLCQKDYRNVNELELHISENHTQSEYLCGQCGLSFNSSKILVSHIVEKHSGAKDNTEAYVSMTKVTCTDNSPQAGSPQSKEDKSNEAIVLEETADQGAGDIGYNTEDEQANIGREQTTHSERNGFKDNRFIPSMSDISNTKLKTQKEKIEVLKTNLSGMFTNTRTSLKDKVHNRSDKKSDDSYRKQTRLRPRVNTVYSHLYTQKSVASKNSDICKSKPHGKGILPKKISQSFDGVETVPTSLLLRYLHQVQCLGCFNITVLNASGRCSFCQKSVVVKLHQFMCICRHSCFRSVDVLTTHFRGCETLQAAVSSKKKLVIYSEQEGTQKIREVDTAVHTKDSQSECYSLPVKTGFLLRNAHVNDKPISECTREGKSVHEEQTRSSLNQSESPFSSDSLLQERTYGNSSNGNGTVLYGHSSKINEKDSGEIPESNEENVKYTHTRVKADKIQVVDARENDEPSYVTISDNNESEVSESDSSGFEEIYIDEGNISNKSKHARKDNNDKSFASSKTDLQRVRVEDSVSDKERCDQSLINFNSMSCKVVVERMLPSEVENYLRKRKRVPPTEEYESPRKKQTRKDQLHGNLAERGAKSEKRNDDVRKVKPIVRRYVEQNDDERNFEALDTIVISSDSDEGIESTDVTEVHRTYSNTSNDLRKKRISGVENTSNSSLVSKNKSVARKRGHPRMSNRKEHSVQKLRCSPRSRSLKTSESSKSFENDRNATVDKPHICTDNVQSGEIKDSSKPENLKSYSPLKFLEKSEQISPEVDQIQDKKHSLSDEVFTCEICTLQFSCTHDLAVHAKTHLISELFKCSKCERVFSSEDSLNAHLDNHKKAEEFLCGICQAIFRSTNELENHMFKHFESVVTKKNLPACVASSETMEIVDADSSSTVECSARKDVGKSNSLISKLIAYKPNINL
ncbi:uncharacterized protein LOC123561520 isoform X2 [Mercenaria mercenaria]|uniref:uncharacterized protein LOC123561520 isoform X2 n=1 Tax=Mercenaria mercenaria TaxID=6596 RepID=UPI00234F88A2|nr:uncharacterized protein LOC123561520 isoform X2 [Mercenaria mercenaria]